MAENIKTIKNLTELQKMMPRLLEKYGEEQHLVKAAMANPILALEHIGIKLTPKVAEEVESRARFGTETGDKIQKIQTKVNKLTGRDFDLESNTVITNFLKKELKEELIIDNKIIPFSELKKSIIERPKTIAFFNKKGSVIDPLQRFEKSHKLIPMLLEYRALQARIPALASIKVFNEILKNSTDTKGIKFSNVKFRLQDRNKRKIA
ncbi:hypothetical protein [Aquimarina rhabdastrellae]